MATVELDAHAPVERGIIVDSVWSEKDLVQSIPGARWDSQIKKWRLPLTWASCIMLRGVFRDHLVIGPQLTKWSWEKYNDVYLAVQSRNRTELSDEDTSLEATIVRTWRDENVT